MTATVSAEKNMADQGREEKTILPVRYGCEILLEKIYYVWYIFHVYHEHLNYDNHHLQNHFWNTIYYRLN